MKVLKDILYKARITDVTGSTDREVSAITFDSRAVEKGGLFVAIRGEKADGHQFIQKAVEQGAVAVVCEELPAELPEQVTFVKVKDSRESLGYIAANFYDHPSENLKLVGITGTNGKTTTTTLLFNLFRELGYSCGLISTVSNWINDKEIPATHTTPDAISFNQLLAEMTEAGCEYCFMEVSSHALVQHRVTGAKFSGGVFTNITHEHLDYHKTFKEYIRAKKLLFDNLPEDAFALVNVDDSRGEVMLQNTKALKRTFGLKSMADYRAKLIENQFSGLHMTLGGKDLYSRLIGDFNAYNLLAVYGVAMELEADQMEVLTKISTLKAVDGRFQYVKTPNNVTAIVDYAHTPDALKNVLKTIQNIRTGNEKVITIVGCGGDRDTAKRPVMAELAAHYSDQVILTSDNPRTEDPQAIIDDMKTGLDPVQMKKTLSLTDRREAIKLACTMATNGDIILIAGKGHEKYQEINGVKKDFDDLKIVNETLKTLEK
ncbi:UDP-N-acetylmuramoyl-L-alanyl-D-glutamate--2,6-diaminopimelate ligase [Halocola ammonii]